ncbi:MAG: class I SAM-dependent methyltransferase [Bacillota bacterium]
MKWTFHSPQFHYDAYHPSIKPSSAWLGHRHFAYDLIRFMKPGTIVELGTHWGASFFCFCQAAADDGMNAVCYAVDTWQGDPHTGTYGEEVYLGVSEIVNQYFPSNAVLLRSTFDDALGQFQNESIDFLHIDGYHTYEQVLHDFEAWLPKLAKNGVILLHDTAVRSYGFGVYRLWETLRARYPSLEFEHSSGLAVLFPKGYDPCFDPVFQKKDDFSAIYSKKI